MTHHTDTTFVIRLTPPGRGAVAVVLVAGPRAVAAVDGLFHSRRRGPLADVPPGRICYGHWGAADGEDVVVVRRPPGAGDDAEQVEVHCHGGAAAVRAVIESLERAGYTEIAWRDWLAMSDPDPLGAAAGQALALAPTARTARILLDQWHGALRAAIEQAVAVIADGNGPAAVALLDELLRFRGLGLHLTAPWRVVLSGPTNVGKSSLINALVGFERAIVCDQPGTTRDVVTAVTAVEGWPVELSDTAGLRATGDPLEIEGIRRATATCAAADLVLVVDDARNPPPTDSISDGPNVIHVRNKLDLLHAESEPHSTTSNSPIVFTSAVTGAGIDTLVAAIGQQLVDDPPPAGAAVPFTAQQFDALDASRELLMASEHAAARDALLALLA